MEHINCRYYIRVLALLSLSSPPNFSQGLLKPNLATEVFSAVLEEVSGASNRCVLTLDLLSHREEMILVPCGVLKGIIRVGVTPVVAGYDPSTDPSLCILTNQNVMQILCCVSPVEGEQGPSHDLPHSFKILLAIDDFNGCFNPTTLKLKDKEWVRHFTVPLLVTLWVLHVCSFQCINDLLQEN